MPFWTAASATYFTYVALVAWALPGVPARARVRATLVCMGGLLVALAGALAAPFWLRLVVLPPVALLVAYWASGLLWVGPMPRAEALLGRADAAMRIRWIAAATPRPIIELLEFSYAGVYPLIPIALALHMLYGPSPDADRFWSVILVTDFVCFGMLPWIQTRPPRMLEQGPPWRSGFRAFNIRMLGEASIGVNTVPSGHAAEALAGALLLADAPWPIAAWMWFNALCISSAAVLGRYHFALDAIAGWLVALLVWVALQ